MLQIENGDTFLFEGAPFKIVAEVFSVKSLRYLRAMDYIDDEHYFNYANDDFIIDLKAEVKNFYWCVEETQHDSGQYCKVLESMDYELKPSLSELAELGLVATDDTHKKIKNYENLYRDELEMNLNQYD
jgi:hypothetical protein